MSILWRFVMAAVLMRGVAHGAEQKRPNFLIIITDQQRADSMACSWPKWRKSQLTVQTPNLDALAAGGVRFARAYCSNPVCMPTRATIMTGLMPSSHGVRTNGINLDPDFPTVASALADAGYKTHSIGKIHLQTFLSPWKKGGKPKMDRRFYPETEWAWTKGGLKRIATPYYGFQGVEFTGSHGPHVYGDYLNWLRKTHPKEAKLFSREASAPSETGAPQTFKLKLPAELHYNAWIADRTIEYLKKASRDRKPFMVFASFPDPHHPWTAPEPWYSMYDRAAMPEPVRREGEMEDMPGYLSKAVAKQAKGFKKGRAPMDDQLREMEAVTWGMVSFIDQQVGRILAALEELGLEEDTVVVFMSDHGEMLGDHWLIQKGNYPYQSLLNVPSVWRWPGKIQKGKVSQALTAHLDFAPTILDLAGVEQMEYHTAKGGAIVTAKNIAPLAGRSMVPVLTGEKEKVQDAVLVEQDADWQSLRIRTLVTKDYQMTVYVGEGGEEPYGVLFDLAKDPGQLHNRWNDPKYAKVKAGLKERLMAELVRVDNRSPRQHTDW